MCFLYPIWSQMQRCTLSSNWVFVWLYIFNGSFPGILSTNQCISWRKQSFLEFGKNEISDQMVIRSNQLKKIVTFYKNKKKCGQIVNNAEQKTRLYDNFPGRCDSPKRSIVTHFFLKKNTQKWLWSLITTKVLIFQKFWSRH